MKTLQPENFQDTYEFPLEKNKLDFIYANHYKIFTKWEINKYKCIFFVKFKFLQQREGFDSIKNDLNNFFQNPGRKIYQNENY